MKAAARTAALAAQVVAVLGAVSHWLQRIPGVALPLAALTDPGRHALTQAGSGAGWLVIGAAAAGAAGALAGSRWVLIGAAAAQFVTVTDFIVLEGIRRAPGNYDAVDIASGCWLVLAASIAGILIGAVGRRPRARTGAAQ